MSDQTSAVIKLLEKYTISAWVVDEDENIVYMNPHMQDLFGNLAGEKTSIIYESSSFEILSSPEENVEGPSEVMISDVPFKRTGSFVDFGDEGKFSVEFFDDISEQKHDHANMTHALAKLNAETRMAKTIQNSILPIDDIYWNTIAFSSLYMPADDLGGDFYDVLKLSEDEYLIYIADVSGHGIQASLLTVFMRERVRTNVSAAISGTGELLGKLVQDFNALEIDGMMYVTMALCKYTKSRRELSISNAGHNCSPLIIRDNGRTETIPIRGMPVCAIAGDVDYEEEIVGMKPGDRLILFTDGIVEEIDSATGQSFGPEGVRKLAEKHHAYNGGYLARTIMDESARYVLISAKDDRTIVIADILS